MKYESRRRPPERFNALSQLIWDHMRETNETVSDIARRGGMARQTVTATLYRPEVSQMPRPDTLAKLAKGLRLSEELVRERAAMAAMEYGHTNGDNGLSVREAWRADPVLAMIVENTRKLDDEGRRVVLATAKALVLGHHTRHTT